MRTQGILSIFVLVLAICDLGLGKDFSAQRAKPPVFPQSVRDIFFDDAREQLVGERPSLTKPTQQKVRQKLESGSNGNVRWSQVVKADTVVTEIKRLANQLSASTQRSGAFINGGHRECEKSFALLSMWFQVVDEYDAEIRWQEEAQTLRTYLAAVTDICSEGSEESFIAAEEAIALLAELLRGQSPSFSARINSEEDPTSLDELMQRMKRAIEETISPALAEKKEFRRKRRDVAHEAQVLAVLASVIQKTEFGYSGEESYHEFAHKLLQTSTVLSQAAEQGDYQQAEQASVSVKQSCVRCHEEFRG